MKTHPGPQPSARRGWPGRCTPCSGVARAAQGCPGVAAVVKAHFAHSVVADPAPPRRLIGAAALRLAVPAPPDRVIVFIMRPFCRVLGRLDESAATWRPSQAARARQGAASPCFPRDPATSRWDETAYEFPGALAALRCAAVRPPPWRPRAPRACSSEEVGPTRRVASRRLGVGVPVRRHCVARRSF